MPDFWSKVFTLFGFLIGLVIWRIQLIAKRRTELAEEALLAFARASDALSHARNASSAPGEAIELRQELGAPENAQLPGQKYYIILRRLRLQNDRFVDLRRVQLLCRYHFGEDAYVPFEKLFSVKNCLLRAANEGLGMLSRDSKFTPADGKRLEAREAAIWQGAAEPDSIVGIISGAQNELEVILTPHLRADAALLPIATHWRGLKRRWPTINRGGSDTAPRKGDG